MLADWNTESSWNTFGGNGVQADDVEAVAAAERRPLLTVFYLLRGDADGDGVLALNDLIALRGKLNAPVEECPACDVNQDGTINIADARALLLLIRR